jgi:hypothetical protein
MRSLHIILGILFFPKSKRRKPQSLNPHREQITEISRKNISVFQRNKTNAKDSIFMVILVCGFSLGAD